MSKPGADPKAELKQLVPESRVELLHLKACLVAAMDELDVLTAQAGDALNPVLTQQIKADLMDAYSSARTLRDLLAGIMNTGQRLLAQRQSALEAFEMGWSARYLDILARLPQVDSEALRRAVECIGEEEGGLF